MSFQYGLEYRRKPHKEKGLNLAFRGETIFFMWEIRNIKKLELMLNTEVLRESIGGLSRKNPAIVNILKMVCSDMDVTWQPRRVDWSAHV